MGWRSCFVAAGIIGFFGGTGLAAEKPRPPHDLQLISHGLEAELETGELVVIPVVAANEGRVPWAAEDGFSLSYHWFDRASQVVIWDGWRSVFEHPVPSGETVSIMATVEAPPLPGEYLLRWDVVQEGVLWVSETDPTPVEAVAVSVGVSHAFSVLEMSPPWVMVAGLGTSVELVLRNEGTRSWRADGAFSAAYHWMGRDGETVVWEGRRTRFPADVDPGQMVEISVVVTAPRETGLFQLHWDLVEEGVIWFSDRATAPPPQSMVLVAPDPIADPRWWALLCLFAAAAAVSVATRGGPRTWVSFFAAADVLWCAGALAVKQGSVIASTGNGATSGGWFLILGGAACLALLAGTLPGKFRGWACWLFVASGTMLLWADAVYLRFFGDLPSAGALAAVGQLGQVEASIRSLFTTTDIWLWIDLLPGLVLVLVAAGLRRQMGPRKQRAVVGILFALVLLGAIASIRLAVTQPGLLRQMFHRVVVAREVGVFNLHLIDGGRSLAAAVLGRDLEPEQFAEVVEWFHERTPARAGTGPWFGSAEGANLVMVQVESLQGFVIGLEINGREVTPFLNRWREEALWFSNVTDQSGEGRSSDSEFLTQVSLLPAAGAAAAFRHTGNEFTGLAGVLSQRGYHTVSAVPYEGSFWNRRLNHPAFGYAQSLFVEDFSADETIGWGLNDRDFLAQMVSRFGSMEQPFAAYLLTLSLHHPFEGFPEQHKLLDVGRWQGTPFGNFLHTMHFFDEALSAFVTELKSEGLADNTVIAIWGDHDAGFEWRPDIASVMGVPHDPAGWYLSQEVPVFIRVPGAEALRGEHVVPAGHADVMPTLLALLGVDPAPYALIGRNLLGTPGDGPVVGEYGCWRDARHLYLQGDGSLEGGQCLETTTLRMLPSSVCEQGFESARRIEAVSAVVLEHDLQQRIHSELTVAAEAIE
jgi:phosphoglycerol transferase MdoB-like AlkP superfamily enzyme